MCSFVLWAKYSSFSVLEVTVIIKIVQQPTKYLPRRYHHRKRSKVDLLRVWFVI